MMRKYNRLIETNIFNGTVSNQGRNEKLEQRKRNLIRINDEIKTWTA